jgi:hypothetical protein
VKIVNCSIPVEGKTAIAFGDPRRLEGISLNAVESMLIRKMGIDEATYIASRNRYRQGKDPLSDTAWGRRVRSGGGEDGEERATGYPTGFRST